jgi:hypothetical protein
MGGEEGDLVGFGTRAEAAEEGAGAAEQDHQEGEVLQLV